MSFGFINGLPGVGTAVTASPVNILRSLDKFSTAPGGFVLSGSRCADPGNTGNPEVLRSGTALGKVTTGGLYANSIFGLTNAAYTSGGTSLTVLAATATEIARLITLTGASVALKVIGPPSAAGTVATLTTTCSAASGTTLTLTNLGANVASGSIVSPADGSETIKGLLFAEWGVRMTDQGGTRLDQSLRNLLVSGDILASTLPYYSSMDASVKTWLKGQLNSNGQTFTFDDNY